MPVTIANNFLHELAPEIKWEEMTQPLCVAGGCLRDAWFDKPVKDIDVFVGLHETLLKQLYAAGGFVLRGSSFYPMGIGRRLLRGLSTRKGYVFVLNGDNDKYEMDKFLSATCKDLPGLNLILRVCNSIVTDRQFAEELIEEFPCSISQIAWLPKTDEWVLHTEFQLSEVKRLIRFYERCPSEYYDRIREKYDNAEWVYQVEIGDMMVRWLRGIL